MWIINLITNLNIYIYIFNIKIQSVTLFFLTWRSSKNKRINRGSRAQVLGEVEIRTTSKTDQQPSNNPEAITTVRSNRIQNHSVEKTEEKGRKRVQDNTTEKGPKRRAFYFITRMRTSFPGSERLARRTRTALSLSLSLKIRL